MARALWVVAAACALAGCARRARIEITPVSGAKPPTAILRCRTTGPAAARFTWELGKAVRPIGTGPRDQAALLVQWTAGGPSAQLGITCTAEDADGRKLSAGTSLARIDVTRASVAGGVVTVEGAGLGAPVGDEDGVWLLQKGRALRADTACKGSSWDDKKIVACAPLGVSGRAELRLSSGGRLASQAVDVKP
jgi:hypothetical protein